MAVRRTKSGYQLWWYDAEGKFRKRTIKGIGRDEAVRMEREIPGRSRPWGAAAG